MHDELMICLFCESRAQVDEVEMGIYAACCDNCGCMGPIADSTSEAAELWNKRTATDHE